MTTTDHGLEALWQEFFTAAQAVGQQPASVSDKGSALTQLGLHYRMREIYRRLAAQFGTRILSGPLQGTELGTQGEYMSAAPARLMGLYEYTLLPAVEGALTKNYDTLINVGAGEGYYAIGIARRVPNIKVIAADTSADMRKACEKLVVANNVTDRVQVTGTLAPADFATLVRGHTLVFCDIEGAEEELLNPVAAPALLQTDLIIELHNVYRPGIADRLAAQYAATHDIAIIEPASPQVNLPFMRDWNDLDRFLLTYEGREGHTPWGVFTRKA